MITRRAITLFGAVAGCVPLAMRARANSALASSDPANGSTVASPRWLRLYFTAEVVVQDLVLRDAEGRSFPLHWSRPEDASTTVEALVPATLAPGRYNLAWTAGPDGAVPEAGHVLFTVTGGP